MATQPAGPQAANGSGTSPSARDVTHSARRWWALVAIAASVLVVGLDLTVLNLALPTMAVSLHASTGDLQWIVDSYSLVLAALILPAGLLGDRYGRKRMLVVALVIFGAASLACAYATLGGRADRRPGGARHRRGGHLPAGPVGAAGAVRRRGPAAGGRRHRRCHHAQLPDRPDRRRLPARPLLVGLRLPDQRPGRRARADRRHHAAARVAVGPPAGHRPAGPRRLRRRPGRAHLRLHQGGPGRLVGRRRARP